MPWVWMRADNDAVIERLYGKFLTQGIIALQGQRVGSDDRCMAIMVADGSVLADFYVAFGRYAVDLPQEQTFSSFRSLIANQFRNTDIIPVPTTQIIPHKHFSVVAYGTYLTLYQECKRANAGKTLLQIATDSATNNVMPIIVSVIYIGLDMKYVIIDGHSRYEVMKEIWGESQPIPVRVIDYMNPHIFANTVDRLPYTSHNLHDRNFDQKNIVLNAVTAGNKLPVTRNSHQVLCNGQLFPIRVITTTFNDPA